MSEVIEVQLQKFNRVILAILAILDQYLVEIDLNDLRLQESRLVNHMYEVGSV